MHSLAKPSPQNSGGITDPPSLITNIGQREYKIQSYQRLNNLYPFNFLSKSLHSHSKRLRFTFSVDFPPQPFPNSPFPHSTLQPNTCADRKMLTQEILLTNKATYAKKPKAGRWRLPGEGLWEIPPGGQRGAASPGVAATCAIAPPGRSYIENREYVLKCFIELHLL